MEGMEPYWNIAMGAPPIMIGSPGHMAQGSRVNQAWQDFYDYSTYRAYMGQEIGVHQPDWQGVNWDANMGGNVYSDKWSFNQLPGQGADWADAHDAYKAAQVSASWGGKMGQGGGAQGHRGYEEGAPAMEYLAYNDPMAYIKFTAPSNDLWQFMGMRLYGGL